MPLATDKSSCSYVQTLWFLCLKLLLLHLMNKIPLLGMTPDELGDVAAGAGMKPYSARQMARWLYVRGVRSIDEMTDLPMSARQTLSERYTVGMMEAAECVRSTDGTEKYLFPTASGKHVETVFIPDKERATLCVSSQVGCRMNCLFCQTGKQGYEGSLTVSDILNQIYALPHREKLTNIVFMGQGEPLDNIDNVLKSVDIITASYGMAWSPKRVTVSTVGVRGKVKRLLDESNCHIAVSLHTPFAEQRAMLMPAERSMPIAETVRLLRQYSFTHQRRLSFEYIVFAGLNDTMEHARAVASLLRGIECRVNLIRFHEIPGVDLHPAADNVMIAFRDYLTHHGIFTTIRASRGQDIYAACGLLYTKERKALS